MKTVLALAAGASALVAPAAPKAQRTVVKALDTELGVLPPLGFFDPLGLAAKGSAEDFERRRITELKHGRVAMAGFVGYLVHAQGITCAAAPRSTIYWSLG